MSSDDVIDQKMSEGGGVSPWWLLLFPFLVVSPLTTPIVVAAGAGVAARVYEKLPRDDQDQNGLGMLPLLIVGGAAAWFIWKGKL